VSGISFFRAGMQPVAVTFAAEGADAWVLGRQSG
jgi:hypothetical protein